MIDIVIRVEINIGAYTYCHAYLNWVKLVITGGLFFSISGLQLQGWELAVRDKSAPELRLEYLLLKHKAREQDQSRVLQPDSSFSMGIDMTDLFDRYLQVRA